MTAKKQTLEVLVEQANAGNRESLEELIRSVQDRIYGLALRMLYHPADARDETQEILIKIITHLGSFKGKSSFTTWAYRIASNHLLTARKRRAEKWELTFEKYEQGIEDGLAYPGQEPINDAEKELLFEETRLACMQGMLLCLNRNARMAFILGDIFGVTSMEGGQILSIAPDTFRQHLSRSRKQLRQFLVENCGLFNTNNPCRCERQLPSDIEKRRLVDPRNLLFATHPCRTRRNGMAESGLQEIDEMKRLTLFFRNQPDYASPENFVDIVKDLLDSGQLQTLSISNGG